MNYHTIELFYKLTSDEFYHIKNLFYKSKSRTYEDYDKHMPCLICEALKKYGIIMKINVFTKEDYTFYLLYYRINPRRVMDLNNYIGLFNSEDSDEMLDRVNDHLYNFGKIMPSVDSCRLNRIDFCSNIRLSSQEEIFEYIKILQRGYYPKKYIPEKVYDEVSKRAVFYKNSITISREKIVDVVYYNKFDQLNQHKFCDNIDEAKNILRAEIQCNKRKIKHLSDKFGCTQVRTFLKNSDKIGDYVFEKYSNIFYGSGDFYKLDEIYEKIDNSTYKKKSKIIMKDIAQLSAKHSSLEKAFRKLALNKKEIKNMMKRFNKIGVSPVVIPRRSQYDFFKNPLPLAIQYSD